MVAVFDQMHREWHVDVMIIRKPSAPFSMVWTSKARSRQLSLEKEQTLRKKVKKHERKYLTGKNSCRIDLNVL